jgi:hypothetical protein
MRQIILENEYMRVEEDDEYRVIVAIRKSTPASSVSAIVTTFEDLNTMLASRHRGWGLVIDARLAPGNNDESFERPIRLLMQDAAKRFPRIVVLVATAAGVLQANRVRKGGVQTAVTRDPDEALAMASGMRVH